MLETGFQPRSPCFSPIPQYLPSVQGMSWWPQQTALQNVLSSLCFPAPIPCHHFTVHMLYEENSGYYKCSVRIIEE